MSISGISGNLTSAPSSASGKLFLPGASEFANTLAIGQIIKGRVLRQYDDSRYLVDFGGNERVVDSAVPLTSGELLYGRVVGLGDRVELQRIAIQNASQQGDSPAGSGNAIPQGRQTGPDELLNTLANFRVTLNPTDQATLTRAVQAAGDKSAMTIAGLLLSKLGLSQSPDMLNAVYDALRARRTGNSSASAIDMKELMQGAASVVPSALIVTQLGDLLRQSLEEALQQSVDSGQSTTTATSANSADLSAVQNAKSQNSDINGEANSQDPGTMLGQWILNAQTDSSVAHRTGTIPLLVGGRLMEVDVALFEQRQRAVRNVDARHRHLIFRLNTEKLGAVEVSARVVGNRVRVRVVSANEEASMALSGETQSLRTALADSGWKVDEVAYGTEQMSQQNSASNAVAQHVINQDSLSRLI